MNKISKFLSVPLRFIKRESKLGKRVSTEGFEVRSGSYLANYTILSYLIKYPLFSYKYVREVLRLSLNKSYRTPEGLQILTDLKASMDFYSSSSNWEHINTNFWNSWFFIKNF